MADARKQQKIERQEILVAMMAKEQREDRRSKFWIYGSGTVLLLALIVTVTSVITVGQKNKTRLAVAASKPIKGVQTFTGMTRNHTSSRLVYLQNPPSGGDHDPQFINCGTYTKPVNSGEAVHSLEHGAVWVMYRPDLPQQQINALAKEAASFRYELLSPYPGLPSPVVASAWGKQLKMESATDQRLPVFLQRYSQGPQTPEHGALCSGGSQG